MKFIQLWCAAIVALAVLALAKQAYGQQTYLHCGQLVDVKKQRMLSRMTVVVEGDKIVAVEEGYQEPGSDDVLIDLTTKVVMPGLMDMHVHLEGQSSPQRYILRFTANPADVAFGATVYARKTLMAGFTTVRDVGGSGVNISLRNAINKGLVVGPHIYTAGKVIATTGGHGDPTNGMSTALMGDPGPAEGVANGPADCRKAVRQRYKNGADLIKVTATGGVLSVAKDGSGPQFDLEELQAVIETANDYGMTVAAHAHGAEGMRRAVEAGVTSIEHGTLMTEEVMDLMVAKGTWYVPTITAGKSVEINAKKPGYYPELVVPKALAIGPKVQDTFGKAYKKGVKIAFGTDAGVFNHGENGREFGYMVEAGMPPMEALVSATLHAAQLLRIDDRVGAIEAGLLADIVAVDENPLDNIKIMEQVSFVMKAGVVYKQ